MKEYKVKVFANRVEWYFEGKLHREGGPAIEFADGGKEWYKNDKLHREDGPAIEWFSGTKIWYKNNLRHRENGPAIEYFYGHKEWYLEGKWLTKLEFDKAIKANKAKSAPTCDNKYVEVDGIKYKLVKI